VILLAGYEVIEPLGKGRTGEVFRLRRASDGAQFAVRRVAAPLAARAGVAESLQELPTLCEGLRSPFAVPVAEVRVSSDGLLVFEPWVDGEPIEALLDGGPLKEHVLRDLTEQLCAAVKDLHRRKIVHGDLRPSNVLRTDYGLRVVGAGVALRTKRRSGHTSFLMRDPYDAPELDSGQSSHKTDLFAVGSLLMYAVTGEAGPYEYATQTDDLRDVLFEAMSPDPKDRMSSVEDLRERVLAKIGREGIQRPRQQTGPVITSWGASTSQTAPVPPEIAFPEEEELATRGEGMKAVPDPGSFATPSQIAQPEPAPAFEVAILDVQEGPKSAFPTDSPNFAEMEAALQAERARQRKAEAEGKRFADPAPESGLEPVEEPILGRSGPTVTARKPGTKPRGEWISEIGDVVGPLLQRFKVPLAGLGVFVLLVLGIRALPERPDEMLKVAPEGQVTVGDPEGQRDEQPGATVAVAPFLLDRGEVTADAYRDCMAQQACSKPSLPLPAGRLPATGVNWIQAQAYCRWAGKRLPTENEWEAAARLRGKWPWGDEGISCSRARYGRYQGGECAEPGVDGAAAAVPGDDVLEASGLPVDLIGNVWELVDTDYSPARGAGSGSASVPGQTTLRVIKGGAWSASAAELRPGGRVGVRSDYAAADVGFRCAKDL